MLAALRCPECTAPVRALPPAGETARCAYCGGAIVIAASAGGRTETHFAVVLRVGPSNVDRVVRILQDHLHVAPTEARARLAQPPARFPIGPEEERACAVASATSEGGAQTEVVAYPVTIPFRTVTLEDAGANALRVIAVLRAEIALSVMEAKRVVAETPCVIATGVDDAIALALVAALQTAGAKVSAA